MVSMSDLLQVQGKDMTDILIPNRFCPREEVNSLQNQMDIIKVKDTREICKGDEI